MTILDQCTRRAFEISPAGTAVGWQFGDFAAHAHGSNWTITHLPSGRSMRQAHCWFKAVEPAVAAMIEISRKRNSWDFLEADDAMLAQLRDEIIEIADRHGGKDPPFQSTYKPYRGGLNGYAAPAVTSRQSGGE